MKRTLTKIGIGLLLTTVALSSNENINRSLNSKNINNSSVINKNLLQDIQRKALVSVGKSFNVDSSLFDKNKKFSLYLKVSSTSKIGFKYKF